MDVASAEGTQRVTTEIAVRDVFIAGLGDSIASGEGNPDRAVALSDTGFCFRSYIGAGWNYYRPGRAGFKGDKSCEGSPGSASNALSAWQRWQPLSIAVAFATIAIVKLWTPLNRRVPAMLVGVVAGTVLAHVAMGAMPALPVLKTVPALPGAVPALSAPDLSIETIRKLFSAILVMTMLKSIEAVAISPMRLVVTASEPSVVNGSSQMREALLTSSGAASVSARKIESKQDASAFLAHSI